MDFILEPEYKNMLAKNIDEIYSAFKNKENQEFWDQMGDAYFSSVLRERQWEKEDEDKEFIIKLLDSIGMIREPQIIFNDGIYEEKLEFNIKEGFNRKSTIELVNNSKDRFKLVIKNIYSSNFIDLIETKSETSESMESIMINYRLNIPPNISRDYSEHIILITNYKTYIYKIHCKCNKGIAFGFDYDFKTLEDFYKLYESNYTAALGCFINDRFIEWLMDNNFRNAIELYRKFKASATTYESLQNFLQLLGFNLEPNLEVKYVGDTLTIKNTGNGYLYGRLECSKNVFADKQEWSQKNVNDDINIICYGTGTIKVLSNGGCKVIILGTYNNFLTPCEKIEREYKIKFPSKGKIKIYGKFDIPKINIDNYFVACHVDAFNNVIIKRNISLLNYMVCKIKKIELMTNVSIVYPDRLFNLKIRLN